MDFQHKGTIPRLLSNGILEKALECAAVVCEERMVEMVPRAFGGPGFCHDGSMSSDNYLCRFS